MSYRRSPAGEHMPPQKRTLCTLVLDKNSIRVFGSVMQFLGKVGPDLFIEIGPHDCAFRSLTDSGQSFAACKFDRAFFGRFDPPRPAAGAGSDAGSIRCKIAVKNFISAFKNLRAVHAVEISVVRGAVEAVLMFKLRSTLGVVKKYKFCIEECEILEAVFDTVGCLNKVMCSPNKLARMFEHMHGSVEVALELTENHVRVCVLARLVPLRDLFLFTVCLVDPTPCNLVPRRWLAVLTRVCVILSSVGGAAQVHMPIVGHRQRARRTRVPPVRPDHRQRRFRPAAGARGDGIHHLHTAAPRHAAGVCARARARARGGVVGGVFGGIGGPHPPPKNAPPPSG
jgi:hypothetical protein